ncbi:hypothetical protein HX882_06640 [Pseudomonas gingeri]|uniref:Uncharacterized protein n=1 Tax=Pseudomonas gingeri TaxID=117681 RepID=A0A7Y7XBA5_9PSED|nr:hypothetical protein [Pseudomonas gingeri]NWB95563.1 hypothetical protein [Pseudomonas gingeri]
MSDNEKMSWFSALDIMLNGTAFGLGKYHWAKSLWLKFAIMFMVVGPMFEYIDAQDYAGAMPPEAPMIKTTGTFIRYIGYSGAKSVSYIQFNADNGMTYRTQHAVAPAELDGLGGLKSPIKVYAEGFLLRDGSGSFYPLRLTTLSRIDLASPDKLMTSLLIGRNPFHIKKLEGLIFIAVILWGGSFFYAFQLRRFDSRKRDEVRKAKN